ncbi:MAG: ABC-three component system middle component 6 [Methanosarcinaceae archaeon]
MIMPTKHIRFSESILGFGSYILSNLDTPKSVDTLWKKYNADFENELYFAKQSFDNLILAIVFLYSINTIIEEDGELRKCV